MNFLRATFLIAWLTLGIVASAQDYFIRLKYSSNVRDTPGLNGRIIRTAPAGTVLPVVSKFNRWLQVDDAGTSAWLAAWLDYVRVDGVASASPQQSSQVDNCCFVDRQCQSDEEWESGYWAYQSNQCPAVTQPATPVTTQPTTSVTTAVNNCCFVDRQCVTDDEWIDGYRAFQNGQCGAPSQNIAVTRSRPVIEGPADFVRVISSTLDLMEHRAPQWYEYLISVTDLIVEAVTEPTPGSPHANTTNWASGAERTIGVGARNLYCFGGVCRVGLAGILSHEACHIHQHWDGVAVTEPPCQKAARDTHAAIYASYARDRN